MFIDVYYVQTEASDVDTGRTALEALKPVIDQVIALTEGANGSTEGSKPLLQMTYRQLVPIDTPDAKHRMLSGIPFPPPSNQKACSHHHPVTSISGLTDAAVHLAEKVYYDVLASRVSSPACGRKHVEKVEWVKQTVKAQKLERKRRKGRHPSEYHGRGGRGADDGVTKEAKGGEDEATEEQAIVVGFFETSSEQGDGDQDEDDG